MKPLLIAAISLIGAINASFSSDLTFTATERSEDSPDGKRYFTEYHRDGRLILTKVSAPDDARKNGWTRSEAFYVWYSDPKEGVNLFPAMQVFLYGDRRIKTSTYSNGSFWGSAYFIDEDGDGHDDILRLVQHAGKNNGGKSRLIDAFIVTKSGQIQPMEAAALSAEIERYTKEKNG